MTETYIDKQAKTMIQGISALDWNDAIRNDDEQKSAASMLSSVKANAKELKTKKEAITKPLNAALKEVRAQFKPAEDKITFIEQAIKGAMLTYHQIQEAQAQARIDAIEKRTGPGRGKYSTETAMAKLANVEQPRTDLGGAQIKYGPEKVRIIDPFMLPPHYLYDPEVIEALRLVVSRDVKAGQPCPKGAKMYRDQLVAGIAG